MTDGVRGPRILIDSSIWIDFYRPGGPPEVREKVREALAQDAVGTTPSIVTEVARGAPNEEELEALLEDFSGLHQLPSGFEQGAYAARVGFALRRKGTSVPAADLLIAACAVGAGCELWHRDEHYDVIARVCPLQGRNLGAGDA